jgi:hypothetical protein
MKVDPCGQLIETTGRREHGIPFVVKTPTHVRVEIHQTDFYAYQTTDGGPSEYRNSHTHSRSVKIEKIESSQIMMLDPKRPLSGTGQFAIAYSKDGYGTIKTASYKAVDETIKNVTQLAAAVAKASIAFNPKTVMQNQAIQVVETPDRIVASQVFPIEACVNGELEAFVREWTSCDTN